LSVPAVAQRSGVSVAAVYRNLPTRDELLAGYIERHGIDPQSDGGQRLISLLLLINGSLALIELHDRQGLDVDEALDRSLWALRALIDATRQESPTPPPAGRTRRQPEER
jgi:AcrR family transcriptional regulator